MTASPLDRIARSAHPRLLLSTLLGAVVALLGAGLSVIAPAVGLGIRETAARIAILGALLFLAGGSGYLAFSVFERGFE